VLLPPASDAGMGECQTEHRHVQQINRDHCHDGRRQEFAPRRRPRSTRRDRAAAEVVTRPKKPFPCLLASQPATAQLAPMLPSPRNSRTAPHRHTAPQITRTHRPRRASSSSPLNRTSLLTSAVARPRPNPHSNARAPPNTCPFPRFRPLEVFRRRPRARGNVCDSRRLKTFTIAVV
jgi:hypothetical protein